MAQTKGTGKPGEGRAVPIRWERVLESPLIFSNNFVVQHTEHEFILTFAQIQPPILLPGDEERAAQIEAVPAMVAVRIALTPTRLQELMRLLTQNFQNYLERTQAATAQEGEDRNA